MIYGKTDSGFFMPKICNTLASPLNSLNPCYLNFFYAFKFVNGVCTYDENPDFKRDGPITSNGPGSSLSADIPSKAYVTFIRDYYTIKTYNFCIRM